MLSIPTEKFLQMSFLSVVLKGQWKMSMRNLLFSFYGVVKLFSVESVHDALSYISGNNDIYGT